MLLSIDKFFRIEMRFFVANSGELGLRRAQQFILSLFPDKDTVKDAGACLATFQKHLGSGLLEFVGVGARGVYTTVLQWVKSIAEGGAVQEIPDFTQGKWETRKGLSA